MKKLWTVKEVCELTGLTGKHLYHFHHEGVVRAAGYSNFSVYDHDGYKLYDEAGVAKLQQIAMYYELGLKRNEICALMKAPDYDMHRALDELQDRLEEKRLRLCRHISAIEQLRQIGTKNGLLDMFSGLSLDELGKNGLAFSESSLKEYWEKTLDENSLEAFNATTETLLRELVLHNDRADLQKQIVKQLFAEAIRNLGFSGYMFILAIFLATTGEGAMAAELATDLPVTLTPDHGKVALEFIKEDLEILLDEIAYIIAQHHECIGGRYDAPDVSAMVTETKQALLNHIGLKSKDEYAIVLNALVSKENNENPGYLQYLINAMKYHLENNPEIF